MKPASSFFWRKEDMQRKIFQWLSVLLVAAFVLAACAPAAAPTQAPATEAPKATEVMEKPTDAPKPTEAPTAVMTEAPMSKIQLPEVDPGALSGDIISAGSSTVYPLAEAMAARFNKEGFEGLGKITIDSIGSGAGIERFCKAGESDIANSSRAIKDSEVESCRAIGREPVEFRVGTDALAIVVSSQNTFLKNVTLEQLAKIFSKDVTKWNEVDPSWPAEDIKRFSPGTDSGTFDYFVEAVMRPVYKADNEADKKAILDAANIQFSEDDNVLVQGVEGSPYAIGYFGFAYYQENAELLTAVSVEGVAPEAKTAEDGTYKLARPLFIYSDAKIMKEKPQVAAFINFFLTFVNEEIATVGYFPASEEALKQAMQNWLDAMK
jgi:phosphate transport system substrate-binding protein